ALNGDNVVDESINMPWYTGKTLLQTLESVEIENDYNFTDARFPVQYVIRPMNEEFHDYRGFAGKVESGVFKPGDAVIALPSGKESTVKSIDFYGKHLDQAFPPQSVTLTLNDNIDIS